MKLIFELITGLVFGVGIAVSGMMDPAKVLNFFDVAGTWDPSLAFVMGGALIVTFIGYRLVWKRNAPLFGGRFQVPTGTDIDMKLVGGSALFGIGWGIAGFCPGAAIPALGTVVGKCCCSWAQSRLGFICAACSLQRNPRRWRHEAPRCACDRRSPCCFGSRGGWYICGNVWRCTWHDGRNARPWR